MSRAKCVFMHWTGHETVSFRVENASHDVEKLGSESDGCERVSLWFRFASSLVPALPSLSRAIVVAFRNGRAVARDVGEVLDVGCV